MMAAKVIVIGLDGLDSSMIKWMPTVSKLKINLLDSLIPLTFSSWPSIMSGVNPGKHGLIDFFKFYKNKDGWKAKLVSSLDLAYPRIHEIIYLSPFRDKLKYAVINPIPDYPLIPLGNKSNLIAATEFFTPNITTNNMNELEKIYDIDELKNLSKRFREAISCKELVKLSQERLMLHKEALYELDQQDYDLIWININIPDALLHKCPKLLSGKDSLIRQVLNDADGLVKKALKLADNLIIVSDHGFKVYHEVVRLNALLYKEGYAVKASSGKSLSLTYNRSEGITVGASIMRMIYKLGKGPLRMVLKRGFEFTTKVAKLLGKDIVYEIPADVDESKSAAFVPTGTSTMPARYVVLLNDSSVAYKIVNLLRNVGLQAFYAPDLIWGPETPKDVVIVYGGKAHPTVGTVYDQPIERRKIVQHWRYGILASKWSAGVELIPFSNNVVQNYSITPIILCALGVPIDKYMDSYNIATKVCNKISTINYMQRWRIFKNITLKSKILKKY
jgi:hypothetical protein